MSTKNKIFFGLIISVFIVISDNFIFNNIVEIFSYGSELGDISTNVALAYISSYIFYRIVVVEREKEIKRTVYKSVGNTTKKILFNGYYVLDVLAENENIERTSLHTKRKEITKSEYTELCKKINPNSLSRFTKQVDQLELKNLTKIDSLHQQCVEMMKLHIEKVMLFLPYLEDEHIKIINNIHDSRLISCDNALFFARTNTNFVVYQDIMFEYLISIRELEKFYERNIKSIA